MKQFMIGQTEQNLRMDQYLARLLPGAGKSFLYKMLRKKNITLNGKKAEGKERLVPGDEIRIFFSEETYLRFHSPAKQSGLKQGDGAVPTSGTFYEKQAGIVIVYEDRDILIADKPPGLLSQKALPEDYSLNDWFLAYCGREKTASKAGEEAALAFTPSVANRLDRNTSGMVLCGKTLPGARYLSGLLKERSLHKYYLAITLGELKKAKEISGYLIKDAKSNRVTVLDGKSADVTEGNFIRTAYRPLYYDREKNITLTEVLLITGKPHQIRAHLASVGHPLLGDPKYGNRAVNERFRRKYGTDRQLLHCYKLTFPEDAAHSMQAGGRSFLCTPPKDFYNLTGDIYGDLEFPRSSGLHSGGYDQPH